MKDPMNEDLIPNENMNSIYANLIEQIGSTLHEGRSQIALSLQSQLLNAYWQMGRQIVEYERQVNAPIEIGSPLLNRLSQDLALKYGAGFSRSNIFYMRKLYLTYPEPEALPKLTWSHFIELLKIEDPLERSFYEKECLNAHWGVRELRRQMKSMLFHRLALSTDKQEVLRLSKEGQIIEKPEDIIKDPYVFEFTGLPSLPAYKESDLENALIQNLSDFLLELGKGFAYVGRQQSFMLAGRSYKVDLVFYHRILKCFVLIDLKRGEITHEDIGQMNFYLNYYREEMNTEGDTDPIGIVLGAYKDQLVMRYALQNISNQVFATRYQLYLPDRAQVEAELQHLLDEDSTAHESSEHRLKMMSQEKQN